MKHNFNNNFSNKEKPEICQKDLFIKEMKKNGKIDNNINEIHLVCFCKKCNPLYEV